MAKVDDKELNAFMDNRPILKLMMSRLFNSEGG